MAPGSTWRPDASRVSRAAGIAACAPTARMTPSLIATLAASAKSGDTTVPPRMTRSAVTLMDWLSQHDPAAIDRQVDAGDLTRDVAGEKQARIGNVGIRGHALQRIVGGVPCRGLLDRDVEPARHVGAHLLAKARAIDHARRHAIDIDVVGTDLEGKALGDAAQPPLRCRIGHATGTAAHAERAADIDDLAVALRHHRGQDAAHGMEAAVHIEGDDRIELRRGRLDAGLADRPRSA